MTACPLGAHRGKAGDTLQQGLKCLTDGMPRAVGASEVRELACGGRGTLLLQGWLIPPGWRLAGGSS